MAQIQGSTVSDVNGREIDVKRVKAVHSGTTEVVGRFVERNNRVEAQKKQQARPIISELEVILDERGPRVSLASAAVEMRQRIADYDAVSEDTRQADIIRICPEHFRV